MLFHATRHIYNNNHPISPSSVTCHSRSNLTPPQPNPRNEGRGGKTARHRGAVDTHTHILAEQTYVLRS